MEDPRPESLETVAARVVAWHNRHPLARRITAEQVQSVGYVALPYLPPADKAGAADAPKAGPAEPEAAAGGSLRERAVARAKPAGGGAAAPAAKPGKARRGLKAAFTEDFIAPLSPKRVARWAARHGVPLDQAPRGAPLRQVDPDPAFAAKARELQTLYVQTAMVESRGKRVRMLLSPSSDTAVLGGRLWSPPRVAGGAAGALGSLTALGLALALWWQQAPPAPPLKAAANTGAVTQETHHAHPPGSAAVLPSIKPGSLRAAALADAGLASPTAAPASAASGASGALAADRPRTEPPVDVEPTLGRISLPSVGLPRVDEALAAARERRLAQRPPLEVKPAQPAPSPTTAAVAPSASAPPAAAPAATQPAAVAKAPQTPPAPVVPATAPEPPKPQAAAVPPPGHAFALSSRRLRTRAESEQTMAAIQSLLAGAGHAGVQVEVVPAGDDWRVVGWPFGQRAQAEKARALLASRGIRLEVVDF